MAGPVALPPVDQRESTARSRMRGEKAAEGGSEAGAGQAKVPARLAQTANNVAAASRINNM
jgi:hypothetical protein